MVYELLEDGFPTTLALTGTTVSLEFIEIKAPAILGGGGKKVTTMNNTAWHTKAPNVLKELGDSGGKVAYDPKCYDEIIAVCQVNKEITITFPDESTLVFWGWIDEFVPDDFVEGERPEATIKIICSNRNSSGVETAPNYTAAV